MLQHLSVRDFLLIERLELDCRPGFTVITGETGAGKSLLLDSLLLALGEKGSADLVRPGAASASFIAVFDTAPALEPLFSEHDLPRDDTIIVKRILDASGRSKAFLNDTPVSLALLRQAAGMLLEIQGQHCAHRLFTESGQRGILDALTPEPLRVDVRRCAAAVRAAELEAERLKAALEAAQQREDYLRHAAAELSTLEPKPGELERLLDEKQTLNLRSKTESLVSEALQELAHYQDVPALAARLSKRLGAAASSVVEHLSAASDALSLAEEQLEALQSGANDTHRLNQVEERLYALRDAERKFRCAADDLPDLAARFADEVAQLDNGAAALLSAQKILSAARGAYHDSATRLTEARQTAAAKLTKGVMAELKALKLPKAVFRISVTAVPGKISDEGGDSVVFRLQANPDLPEAALAEAASGGELVRVLLALRLASNSAGDLPLLVFDEADQGVGGAVAAAIGARLKLLAAHTQVLAITHAPQVAAAADRHLLAQKSHKGKTTVFNAVYLSADERLEEIARMLAGEETTTAARQAAAALLKVADYAAA
ncbi:MAG: AAA family ATPase [Holosporales bacterium]